MQPARSSAELDVGVLAVGGLVADPQAGDAANALFRNAGDCTPPNASVWEDNLIDLMNWGFVLLMIGLKESCIVVAWKKAMLIVGI